MLTNNNAENGSDIPNKNTLENNQGSSKINQSVRGPASTPTSSSKRFKDGISSLLKESIQQRGKRA